MDGGGGGGSEEDDFSSLPVEQRLASKNWKARVSAYEELIKTFRTSVSEDAPEFGPYLRDPSILRAAVLDPNAVAQEKGLEAVCAFLEYGGQSAAARSREQLVAGLLEKGLWGATRAGTRKNVLELCMLLVECEESSDGLMDSGLLEGLKSKQPKAVAGAVNVVKELVQHFGVKIVNVKPILKIIPTIFAHADKGVRAEGTALVRELHRWLGSALDPHLSELKPVQVKELSEVFAGEERPLQTRFTRSQQREHARKEAEASLVGDHSDGPVNGSHDAGVEEAGTAAVDVFDYMDPVAILDKLPGDFYTMLQSPKWKERKELALDPLVDLLNKSPRLVEANYDELVRALAGRMADANIVCVILAARSIEQLASGLRASFARYKPIVVPALLERTKEKKQNVVDALTGALDASAANVTISDIVEDVSTFAKHKNPQVREQTFKWLDRVLCNSRTAPDLKCDLKPLLDSLLSGLDDSFEPVRSAAAEGLGILLKILGDRPMAAALEGLDDLKRTKVKDFAAKATVKCGSPAASLRVATAPSKPPLGAAKAQPSHSVVKSVSVKPASSSREKENIPVEAVSAALAVTPQSPAKLKSGPPARLLQKRPSPAALPQAPVTKSVNMGVVTAVPTSATKASAEPLRYRYSQEDAEAQAGSILPPEIYDNLTNSNWKARLAAMEDLLVWLESNRSACDSELVARTLQKRPGWKESNFQVFAKMAELLERQCRSSESWSRACSALTIGPLSDKLGDVKLKKVVGDCLMAYAEKYSLQFVLGHAYDPMTKQKAPKAQADALSWVEQCLRDFGIRGLAIREMIDFLKNGLKSSNAAVRTSATKTLVTLRLFVGPDILSFLQDLNPTLLSSIEADFAKISHEPAPAPTRESGDNQAAASAKAGRSDPVGGSEDAAAAALDDLFPRQDVERLIPASVVAACGDANWKARKEALEQMQSTLEANKRIKPNMGGNLGTALKQRLSDSNKMVQALALDVIARLANGMNKPFEKYARPLIGPMVVILADAKASVRAPALACLSAISQQCGLDCLLPGLASGLEATNPTQRKEIVTWLTAALHDSETRSDLTMLIGPILSCLEDRSAEVRKAAQGILPQLVDSVGSSRVLEATSELKPASRATVIPLIEAARASAASNGKKTLQSTSSAKSVQSDSSRPSSAASASADTAAQAAARPVSRILPATSRPLKSNPQSLAAGSAPSNGLSPSDSRSEVGKGPTSSVKALSARAPASPVPTPPSQSNGTSEPPFRSSDMRAKQLRAAKEVGPLRWAVETSARPDQVDYLQHQMSPHVSQELLSLLFSKDLRAEKDHLAGMDIILAALGDRDGAERTYDCSTNELQVRAVANADLILKYLTIRLAETSTSTTLRCLDIVDALFATMLSSSIQLSDYEAVAFMPSLIAKLGDAKELIRTRAREAIRTAGGIYPSSKIFSLFLDHGIKSQNPRTRCESLEEIASLLLRQGPSVCQPVRALPAIARLLSDRDASCRNGALSALSRSFELLGDVCYDHIGALPEKEMSLLEERLKRSLPAAAHQTSAKPAGRAENGDSGRVVPGTPRRLGTRESAGTKPSSRLSLGQDARLATYSRLPSTTIGQVGAKRRTSMIPQVGQAGTSRMMGLPQQGPAKRLTIGRNEPFEDKEYETHVDAAFEPTLDVDETKAVEAWKAVQDDISHRPEKLVPKADQVLAAVTRAVGRSFEKLDAETPQTTLRLCKHLMQTLSAFFDQQELSQAASKDALVDLLQELTLRLLQTSENPASEAITSLSKVLNMILIRIFHNAKRSHCFGALFELLSQSTIDLRDLRGEALQRRSKTGELIMKCLWKISKTAKESLEDGSLDVEQLLRDVDIFLQGVPPAEWRRRAADNVPLGDMPLRTVKTILQQVVATYGDDVYQHLSLISGAENSFVYQYLTRLLNNSRTLQVPVASLKRTDSTATASSATSPRIGKEAEASWRSTPTALPADGRGTDGARMDDTTLNLALKDIFDKIGNAQKSKEGIAELYAFQKARPEAEARINTWIAATGSFFQSYLRRALSNLASDEAERRQAPTAVYDDPPTPLARVNSGHGRAESPSHTNREAQHQSQTPMQHASPTPSPSQTRTSRVVSTASSANDDKLDSLRQMFGVSSRRSLSPT